MNDNSWKLLTAALGGLAIIMAAVITGLMARRTQVDLSGEVRFRNTTQGTKNADRGQEDTGGVSHREREEKPRVVKPQFDPRREVYKRVVDPKKVLESTGISLSRDELLNIKATGQVVTWHIENASGPDGQRFNCDSDCKCTFPAGRFGQLIGKVGESGQVFGVGSSYTATVAVDGILFLGVNDCNDWSNNIGSYDATIEVASYPAPLVRIEED